MFKQALGFTIVELVVVLLLIGALSVTAISRFVEPSAFAPLNIASAFQAQGHYAAQRALTGGWLVNLRIGQTADGWLVEVLDNGLVARATEPQRRNTSVQVINGGNVYDLFAGTNFTLSYAASGELSAGAVGASALDVQAGTELRIQGDSIVEICIYPTGYISARSCE